VIDFRDEVENAFDSMGINPESISNQFHETTCNLKNNMSKEFEHGFPALGRDFCPVGEVTTR
jgi:hypothetical protein